MIRIIFILISAFNCLLTFGQETSKFNTYNIDSVCDTVDGQQNVNYCLGEAQKKLNKIMQTKFECLVDYYNSEIIEYSISKNDSSIAIDLKNKRQFLISSQTYWRKFSEDNASFWEIGG